jgi:hypothetical protein
VHGFNTLGAHFLDFGILETIFFALDSIFWERISSTLAFWVEFDLLCIWIQYSGSTFPGLWHFGKHSLCLVHGVNALGAHFLDFGILETILFALDMDSIFWERISSTLAFWVEFDLLCIWIQYSGSTFPGLWHFG